jgi:hypothetical protein
VFQGYLYEDDKLELVQGYLLRLPSQKHTDQSYHLTTTA